MAPLSSKQSVKIAGLFFYFYIEIYYQFTIRVRDAFKEIKF